MRSMRGWSGSVAMLAMLALAVPASAQDSTEYKNHLYDKWQVGVAFTTVLNGSDARVDGADGSLGTTLNFRDILGISSATIQPAVGLRWKPGRRTEFDVGYQWLNQSGNRSISVDELIIGGDTVSGDLRIKSKIGSDNATLQFKYSLFAAERHNIGLALGLGAILFDVNFDVAGGACAGTNCVSDSLSVSKKLTGPTASLGAFGRWRVGNRWYLGADARGLGARIDRFDISVFEGDATGQYFLSDRWGLELAGFYTNVSVKVGAQSSGVVADDLVGKVAYSYSSVRLGVLAAF